MYCGEHWVHYGVDGMPDKCAMCEVEKAKRTPRLQTVIDTHEGVEMLAGTFFDEEELWELRYNSSTGKKRNLRLIVEAIDDQD